LTETKWYHVEVQRDNYPTPNVAYSKKKRAIDSLYLNTFSTDCGEMCCTPGNWYAGITQFKNPKKIVGAEASIETRVCKPCGIAANDTVQTSGCAHVGVARDTSGFREHQTAWAQVGVTTIRLSGDVERTYTVPYSEMYANPYSWEQATLGFEEFRDGDVHWYTIELDTATGVWKSYVDGVLFEEHNPDTFWVLKYGNRGLFVGEVWHYETDMPGTADDPCSFGSCKLKVAGVGYYSETHFNPEVGDTVLDVVSSFRNWFRTIDADDSMEIGDQSPLP